MCCLELLHREAQAGGSVHFVRNYFWGMILKSAGNMGDGERWRDKRQRWEDCGGIRLPIIRGGKRQIKDART